MSQDNYWNKYYDLSLSATNPSQFAAFVLGEFSDYTSFVDLGCGNGRDSLFFAHFGKTVFGVDASDIAIQKCQKAADDLGIKNADFALLDFNNSDACEYFVSQRAARLKNSILYSRFFLHAIDEEAEKIFLQTTKSLIGDRGKLCLEFRTTRDENLKKVTQKHYRRYIDSAKFLAHISELGFSCDYFCEGFGFAKYKSDDAYVARLVISNA